MKASELVRELQRLILIHGDLDVITGDEEPARAEFNDDLDDQVFLIA